MKRTNYTFHTKDETYEKTLAKGDLERYVLEHEDVILVHHLKDGLPTVDFCMRELDELRSAE